MGFVAWRQGHESPPPSISGQVPLGLAEYVIGIQCRLGHGCISLCMHDFGHQSRWYEVGGLTGRKESWPWDACRALDSALPYPEIAVLGAGMRVVRVLA